MIEFDVADDEAGLRLDKYLRRKLSQIPVSHLFKMIRTKKVRVNGKRASPEQPLAAGDHLAIRGDEQRLIGAQRPAKKAPVPPVNLKNLSILFEDDWMMAIDKPAGMAVHTGSGITSGTAVDYVRAYLGPKAVRNDFAASPAHRLDRDTSGVLLVAKRRPAMVHFTRVFTEGRAKKKYLALVKGRMPSASGTVELPLLERQQTLASKELHGPNLQRAVTHYRVIGSTPKEDGGLPASLLECRIETGRTHQIRRHLSALGHPLAGDRRYGDFAFNRLIKARWGLGRLFLHAAQIEFEHPSDGQMRMVRSPLPPELEGVLKRAGL